MTEQVTAWRDRAGRLWPDRMSAEIADAKSRIAEIARKRAVRARVDAMVAERAGAMVLRPVLIPIALGLPAAWPVEGMSYGDLIARARDRLGVANRYPMYFVAGDLIDYQAAAMAVETLAAEGDRLPAARRVA